MIDRRLLIAGGGLMLAAPCVLAKPSRPIFKVPAEFKTLAEAFAALPPHGGVIEIAPGTYREKLRLETPDVSLIGMGKDPKEVVIIFDDDNKRAGGTGKSASFTVTGDGFFAQNLTIANDYDDTVTPSQAVALYVTSDRAVFKNVRFLGHQDTLYAASKQPSKPSRQYFKDCYIEGHVDFIFGNARAFFDRCDIHMVRYGFITAHSRKSADEETAYVFHRCNITTSGEGDFYLGRAWRPFARVIYLHCTMDQGIHAEGWREWTPGKTDTYLTATFGEYGSTGAGARMSARVAWAKILSKKEAKSYELKAFFKDRSWIRR